MKMTKSQIKGFLKMHRKFERAYLKCRQLENAQRAHQLRVELLQQLKQSRS